MPCIAKALVAVATVFAVGVRADYVMGGQRCNFNNAPDPPIMEDYYKAFGGDGDWHKMCDGGYALIQQDIFDQPDQGYISVQNLCGVGQLDMYMQDDGNLGVYYAGGDGSKIGWCEHHYSSGDCPTFGGGCNSRMQWLCHAPVC